MRSDRNAIPLSCPTATSLFDWDMRSDRNLKLLATFTAGSLFDWDMRSDRNRKPCAVAMFLKSIRLGYAL